MPDSRVMLRYMSPVGVVVDAFKDARELFGSGLSIALGQIDALDARVFQDGLEIGDFMSSYFTYSSEQGVDTVLLPIPGVLLAGQGDESMKHLDDKTLVAMALTQWSNYVETGDITLAAQDAQNMGKNIVKALTDEQKAFVLRLRELSRLALMGCIK